MSGTELGVHVCLPRNHAADRGFSSLMHDLKNQKKSKTYSSRDSHVVTHRSTNLPFNCLCMAERTGCPVFS
ncbi:hypothetical protein KCU99_g7706, partial [Aureobasidium melanogenum]